MWAFSYADQPTFLYGGTDTHAAFTGMRLGKGVFGIAIMSETTLANRAATVAADLASYAVPSTPWLNDATSGVS